MSNFNWGTFVTSFVGYTISNIVGGKSDGAKVAMQQMHGLGGDFKNFAQQTQFVAGMSAFKGGNISALHMQNYQMNNLALLEKSLYFKNILNFPKELNQLVSYLKTAFPNVQAENLQAALKNANLLDLTQVAQLFQMNGKDAIAKIISEMANASKQGINDVSQLKELMKLINASVSTAGQDNPTQTLKALVLLYLPWLPLKEDTGYDLEVEGSESKEDASETYITVLVSTKNYGNLKALLLAGDGNSVTVSINCTPDFPNDVLTKMMNDDAKANSIKLESAYTKVKSEIDENAETKAKIISSNNDKINHLLVIVAHSLIKSVIQIDKGN